jgi:hypothetical protein
MQNEVNFRDQNWAIEIWETINEQLWNLKVKIKQLNYLRPKLNNCKIWKIKYVYLS